jgi:hypothetical protein
LEAEPFQFLLLETEVFHSSQTPQLQPALATELIALASLVTTAHAMEPTTLTAAASLTALTALTMSPSFQTTTPATVQLTAHANSLVTTALATEPPALAFISL